ncbi:MAG: hypothetical protein AB7K67_01860 [Hyphomicrobiaceae bacterium]|jgi:hypothetical protein
MSAISLEIELLERLRAQPDLAGAGLSIAPGWFGDGLVIMSGRHCRGHWRVVDGRFEWTPPGQQGVRESASTVDDAVRCTLRLFLASLPLHTTHKA